MALKMIRVGLVVFLLVAGLCLLRYVWWEFTFYDAVHVQSGPDHFLQLAYNLASAYRAKNGKWPATLQEAWGTEFTFKDPLNRVSERPYYYNPQAKPGTSQILVAQPVPVRVEVWPFKKTWQRGITADGTIVDLQPGDPGFDRGK